MWRLLTAGEKALAISNGLQIENINQVRIYRRAWFFLRGQVSAPDGHIYIPVGNVVGMQWRDDYSVAGLAERSVLVHELVHVYQVRTQHWPLARMGLEWIRSWVSGGYCYCPLRKNFLDFNFEQQAQMLQDRYLLANGGKHWLRSNRGVTLEQLDALIPFPLECRPEQQTTPPG